MSNRWLISDTHFSHQNILTFSDENGKRIRPDWETADEMDDALVENWNSVVKDVTHIVYHLGDVAMPRRGLKLLARCNGRKRLIKGNHDLFKLSDYTPYFEDILGSKVFTPKTHGVKVIMTHIPIHMTSMDRWDACVHGHLHTNTVMKDVGRMGKVTLVPDDRYINVCVEKTNFTPIALDEVLERVIKNG